jgi:uncharacterized protein (DUF433 family)
MLLSISMTKKNLITQDPEILGGKPIIAGTRMSVESILELLSSGVEIKEILVEYSFLKREQVQAAIDYAKNLVGKEESYIFDKSRSVHS